MYNRGEYKIALFDDWKMSADELVEGDNDEEIKRRMLSIIEEEGPIRESLLFKRVLNSVGLKKASERIAAKLKELEKDLGSNFEEEDGECVFFTEKSTSFRPTPDSAIRYSYQIPYYEGANCILYILENGEKSYYTKKELKKLFMSEMGYLKMGSKVKDLFEGSLKDKRIKINGAGRVVK